MIMNNHAKSGFTLVEILIAVTIVSILSGLAIQQFTRYSRRASETRAQAELRTLHTDVSTFKTDTNQYPASLQELIKRPADAAISSKWRGPYLEKDEIPVDPWGEDYQYSRKPKGSKPPFELYSYGAKGTEADPNDYIFLAQ